jgi:4a-hydroxytetrahydrobiopterin dehydratase
MTNLRELKCVPCKGGEPTVTQEEMKEYQTQIPDWQIETVDGIPHLERTFKFKDFSQALDFTNRVGRLAEEEDHHPQIITEWGKVKVAWWTHKIHGLHRNDFVMAAKTDGLYQQD